MRTIIKAIVRILVLLFFIRLLGAMIANLSNFALWIRGDYASRELAIISVGSALLIMVFAILVLYFGWRKTDNIVRILAGDLNEDGLVISTSNFDLHRTLMMFLGAYLIVTSVPNLAGLSANYLFLRIQVPGYPGDKGMSASEISNLVVQTVSLLLGIWLMAGGKTIAKIIRNIYNFGSITHNSEKEQ